MAVNRYPGRCFYCRGQIAASAGLLIRIAGRRSRVPVHLACHDRGEPTVFEVRSGDGRLLGTQNYRGRCEDAPCCGCCTL